ncbi:MAG: MaoC/PaaZ C-terminal domain-containing protein [Telluria sp.]
MPPSVLPTSIPLLLRAAIKRAGPLPTAGAELVRTSYRVDRLDNSQLARYNRALGFAEGALPITFYYLLAQRAHLASMLRPGVPFRIAGMIHVANELTELRPASLHTPLDVHTIVTVAPPQANGAVHVLLKTTGEQHGQPVFTCMSDYLAVRGKRGHGTARDPAAAPGEELAHWSLAPSAGRGYASISGDWNPIHLWPWSARLMGLKTPIIHGMHTVGKACATLESNSGRRITAITARFKAPVALPAEVALSADPGTGRYAIHSAGREAVTGEFAWAAATTGCSAA